MKAMILAAGHGTRMRPLTDNTPKPLLEVGGKPLIVWHIERLAVAGFREIVINIAWLGDQIPERLGDGSDWGVSLSYSDEQDSGALETAGGIIKALHLLHNTDDSKDAPFLVVNGDVWTDYPFSPDFELPANDLMHLVLISNPSHHPTGDFVLDHQRVFDRDAPKLTFSGIAYYRPSLFAAYEQGRRALAPVLRQAMAEAKASGEHFSGDWQDIGTPERLQALDERLKNRLPI